MIIGNTHDETRAFLGGDPSNFTVDWAGLPAKLNQQNMRVDIDPEHASERGHAGEDGQRRQLHFETAP